MRKFVLTFGCYLFTLVATSTLVVFYFGAVNSGKTEEREKGGRGEMNLTVRRDGQTVWTPRMAKIL